MARLNSRRFSFRWTNRSAFVAGSLFLTVAFHYSYVKYLSHLWSYFGFIPITASILSLVLTYVLAVAPATWMPADFKRPTLVLYWSIYAITYIPSIMVLTFAVPEGDPPRFALQLALFAGLQIIGAAYWLPRFRIRREQLNVPSFVVCMVLFGAGLFAMLLYQFGFDLSFAPLDDPYGVRTEANVIGGTLIGYTAAWIPSVVVGILLAMGYVRRNLMLVLAGIGLSAYLYMAVASRAYLTPIVITAAIFAVTIGNRKRLGPAMLLGFAATIVLMTATYTEGLGEGLQTTQGFGPLPIAQFMILFRTFGNAGLMTLQYDNFIASHGTTHWSHVRGVNLLIEYPFQEPLAREVGIDRFGAYDINAVGHFFAYDGIAAAGIPGVIAISVVCMLAFWALDSVSARLDKLFVGLFLCYQITNLNNTGLFTTLLGHGLILQMLVLYVMPRRLAPDAETPARPAGSSALGGPPDDVGDAENEPQQQS
ncbi:MAG: hypothetical protein IH945_00415 [Armatimonadetes bacterium]|nr:hypothetical protein [Armatimonadota bacterium]